MNPLDPADWIAHDPDPVTAAEVAGWDDDVVAARFAAPPPCQDEPDRKPRRLLGRLARGSFPQHLLHALAENAMPRSDDRVRFC